MLKNLKVQTKLIAVLVAPVLVLLLLAYLGFSQRTTDAAEAGRTAELAEFTQVTANVINQLQKESVITSAYDGAKLRAEVDPSAAERVTELQGQMDKQRKATDEAIDAFNQAVTDIDPGRDSAEVAGLLEGQVPREIETLEISRRSYDDLQSKDLTSVGQGFKGAESVFLDVQVGVSKAAADPDLTTGLQTFVALGDLQIEESTSYSFTSAVLEVAYMSNKAGAACLGGPSNAPVEGNLAIIKTDTGSVMGESDSEVAISAAGAECQSYKLLTTSTTDADQLFTAFSRVAPAVEKQNLNNLRASDKVNPATEVMNQVIATAAKTPEAQPATLLLTAPAGDTAAEDRVIGDMNGDPNTFLELSTTSLKAYSDYGDSLITNVIGQARQIQSDDEQARNLYLIGTAAAIIIALGIAFAVARATTRPLAKLTNAAYALSTDKLPGLVERLRSPDAEGESLASTLTPIDIDSKDEVGQLAEAFNSIQQVTIEVAEEQANLLRKGIGDIFINLARRNQTLLDRQIEFIDQLEANEEDPDQLDNLFKLDHLATRMRRNAESLLVLAGAEPPRRRGRPVALADVVRVAIGEVEDFARIQLLALDEATVGGNVAVDLAHLLSELMENATHFSPPDTTVEIVGHRAAEGYVISVTDQGIGMSTEQLGEANTQLARPPLVGLSLSRSLGFIVIGRLASRFSISVKLTASPSGGVTALVTLPSDIVEFAEGDAPDAGPTLAKASPDSGAFAPDMPTVVVDDTPTVSVDDIVVAEEPAFLDQVSDDAFDRGLAELVKGEAPPAPPEPEPVVQVEPEPLPTRGDAAPVVEAEPEPAPVVTAPEPKVEPAPEPVSASLTTPTVETAPVAEAPAAAPVTAAGLVQRTPKKRLADAPSSLRPGAVTRTTGASQRSPEEVRKMLSRYRSGLNRGRTGDETPKDS